MDKVFIAYNNKSVIYTEIPWHFKDADNNDVDVDMKLIKSEKTDYVDISVVVQSYTDEEKQITANRIVILCGEKLVFITDLIKSVEDICVYTDFTAQNSDFSISCNVAEKGKLVIRNSECGVKHFRLLSEIDGVSVADSSGLMMPFAIGTCGDVSYSMYEGLHNHGKMHISCFGICVNNLDKIIHCHFQDTDNGYAAVLSPDKIRWEIQPGTDCVKIYKNSECKGVFALN